MCSAGGEQGVVLAGPRNLVFVGTRSVCEFVGVLVLYQQHVCSLSSSDVAHRLMRTPVHACATVLSAVCLHVFVVHLCVASVGQGEANERSAAVAPVLHGWHLACCHPMYLSVGAEAIHAPSFVCVCSSQQSAVKNLLHVVHIRKPRVLWAGTAGRYTFMSGSVQRGRRLCEVLRQLFV